MSDPTPLPVPEPAGSSAPGQTSTVPPAPVAVIDMGATAVRLVVAQIEPGKPVQVLEEASRGVLLGRDTFSHGVIDSGTIEAALKALTGFRHIMDGYGVRIYRAVATSAVREARNADTFLDRIRIRTGIAFEIINEAEENRLSFLAVREQLKGHAVLRATDTLLVEVGGGSAGLTLLSRGEPRQSGVYALGAIRMRESLGLSRHAHEQRLRLLRRYIANVVDEIRGEVPLRRATHVIAIGGDMRFAASEIVGVDSADATAPEVSREAFLAFCDDVEGDDEERLVERYRLAAADAETFVPAMLVYRHILRETRARRLVVPEASLRAGLLIDLASGGEPAGEDFEQQVLASAEALGRRYRFDAAHGRATMHLSTRLFDELTREHGLGRRERLLMRVSALLHDIGIFISLRAHHKHSQYLLSASQIFGLSNDDLAIVSNIARYHRRGTPQKAHLPYIALDREDRVVVNKLAALVRLANALDAEHLEKVKDVRVYQEDDVWVVELEGHGDLTMERMAATARADMFSEVYGKAIAIRGGGVQP